MNRSLNPILYLRTRFVFGLKAGGSVTHTSGVINALAEEHEIDVISNDDLPGVRVPINLIRPKQRKWLPVAIRELLYNRLVLRYCKTNFHASVIYQRLSSYSTCGAQLAARFNVPLILEYNGSNAWDLKNWSKLRSGYRPKDLMMAVYKHLVEIPFAQWVETYNLKRAALIVVVSDELKKQLEQKGHATERIVCYPNGVDTSVYHPALSGDSVRVQLNLGNSVVMGFIGSFGQWHGTDILAAAIVRFYQKYPEHVGKVRFLLIGDGLMMEKVRRILDGLPNRDDVTLTGLIPQENAVQYLAACDILLSPHKPNPDGTPFFGSPTKLFEYMALGKGIIASRLEQIGDILRDRTDALLVDPGDVESLCEGMHWAVLNPESMAEMGLKAREKVLTHYSWKCHVDHILSRLNGGV